MKLSCFHCFTFSDLLLERVVLSQEESTVHIHLTSVFPHYEESSLAAIVAVHSRSLGVTGESQLMETCTNFLLDENDSQLSEFLLAPAVNYFSDFDESAVAAGNTCGNATTGTK